MGDDRLESQRELVRIQALDDEILRVDGALAACPDERERVDQSLVEAARAIGWSRQKLYRRLEHWRLGSAQERPRRGTTSSDSSTFQ